MKTLIYLFSAAVIFTSTSIATADQSWLEGKWVADAHIGYAPGLNQFASNHFVIDEVNFVWTQVVGHHNETTKFEYELEEDGMIYLYSEKFNTEASVASKGKRVELCFQENCMILNKVSEHPEYRKGAFKTPYAGIAWDWKYGETEVEYEFGFTPFPSSYNDVLPHGYSLNFRAGEHHFLGIFISAFVGEDNMNPADYVGTLNLYINKNGVGVPVAVTEEVFQFEYGKKIRVSGEYDGIELVLNFWITENTPPADGQGHVVNTIISPLGSSSL